MAAARSSSGIAATWSPIGDPHRGLTKGHLEFELHGEKLNGRWHLVRMRAKPREKHENWLLIKGDDEFARPPDDARYPRGAAGVGQDRTVDRRGRRRTARMVVEDRTDRPIRRRRRRQAERRRVEAARRRIRPKSRARQGAMPGFVEPMLATLAKSPPGGERWLHEIKFDGYRLQARIEDGRVTLDDPRRARLDGEIRRRRSPRRFGDLPVRNALIDGELVVENDSGVSDFSLLQADLSEGRTTGSSTTPSISSISTATICAKRR